MTNELDELLKPVKGEDPCGEDLAREGSLYELENLIKIRPKQDDPDQEEETNWGKVRDKSTDLLRRSKDLQVAVIHSLALLKHDGLPGLNTGLTLLQGLLERYWDGLYPRLDPEDNYDPMRRVNILNNLAAPLATGTPFRFLRFLHRVPLANSRQLGSYCLADLLGLPPQGSASGGAAATALPTTAEMDAAFADTPAEELKLTLGAVRACLDSLKAIEDLLARRLPAGKGPNFELLQKALQSIQSRLALHVDGPVPNAKEAGSTGAAETQNPAGPALMSGPIQGRKEVEDALKAICQYYRKHEPASPVPLLLERALRLVRMDFIQSVRELAPDVEPQFKNILGLKEGEKKETP